MEPRDLVALDASLRRAGFELLQPYELLGRGTFGVVYRASRCGASNDGSAERPGEFAVKLVHSATRERHRLRHMELVQALSQRSAYTGMVPISHVGIVEPSSGVMFLVMPYIPTEQPWDTFARASLEDARRYLSGLLMGLAFCEQHGVVHRDVKPRNVLWDPRARRSYLTDFGLVDLEAEIGSRAAAQEARRRVPPAATRWRREDAAAAERLMRRAAVTDRGDRGDGAEEATDLAVPLDERDIRSRQGAVQALVLEHQRRMLQRRRRRRSEALEEVSELSRPEYGGQKEDDGRRRVEEQMSLGGGAALEQRTAETEPSSIVTLRQRAHHRHRRRRPSEG
jgi:serine/threonine protein kinase